VGASQARGAVAALDRAGRDRGADAEPASRHLRATARRPASIRLTMNATGRRGIAAARLLLSIPRGIGFNETMRERALVSHHREIG